MAHAVRSENAPRTLGILAVDPSSRVSGGALLGDRIRIAQEREDGGVFVRSLATRGELGGLARAIPTEVLVLSAAFDLVIVETVGAGQSETDVRDVVDTLVFVLQPGAGDTLQHLKAGDHGDARRLRGEQGRRGERPPGKTCSELRAALSTLTHAGVMTETPPACVATTSARDGTGHHRAARVAGEASRGERADGRAGEA